MAASNATATIPSAEHYSGARAEVLNEAFKTLVLLEGGATVALLGFLQSNWGEKDLAKVMIQGIAFFVVGLGVAIFIPLLRYQGSLLWQRAEQMRESGDLITANRLLDARRPYRHAFLACFVVSMLCFIAGAAWILAKAWGLLNP